MEFKRNEKSIDKINGNLTLLTDYSLPFLKILASKGLDNLNDIKNFINPNIQNMLSPYEIKNMDLAEIRIRTAIEKNQKIMIFGDYDCDGICATSILMLFFKSLNLDCSYFIPDRKDDGYGMSTETLDKIIKQEKFDLLITVDCGITSVAEVEYLKSKNIDVIITDHHEPQDEIPDCIVVDAKVEKKGFFDYCGAGVALKLVEALSSVEESEKYLDIAAIATIADIVPLIGENRTIASLGIKKINKNMRQGISNLLESKTCNSYDIMFRLAPRINAAGRMDNAMKVVDLFLSDDHFVLKGLCEELSKDNAERQKCCESVLKDAYEKLKNVDFSKTFVITLYDKNWEAGVLGIAAAKLVEDFNRPCILFSENDGVLKGSARSIKEVNIFEILSKNKKLFLGFGGHAQAAGLSMELANFPAFFQSINKDLSENFDKNTFTKKSYFDFELKNDVDFLKLSKELALLEPTGYCNSKPNFSIEMQNAKFDQISTTNHIKYAKRDLEILGFSKLEFLDVTKCKCNYEFSLSYNCYQNREYAQGIIKNIWVEDINCLQDNDVQKINLQNFKMSNIRNLEKISLGKAMNFAKQGFGSVFVCYNIKTANEYSKILNLPIVLSKNLNKNPENQILLCPSFSYDFEYFTNIIFLETLIENVWLPKSSNQNNLYIFAKCNNFNLDCPSIELLRQIYIETKKILQSKRIQNFIKLSDELAKTNFDSIDIEIAIKIFEELKLIDVVDKKLVLNNKKVDLLNSKIYKNLSNL